MSDEKRDLDELIPLGEAARRYGLSTNTLRLLAGRGRLKARKLGRDWVTTPRDMEAYLASRANTRPGPRKAST